MKMSTPPLPPPSVNCDTQCRLTPAIKHLGTFVALCCWQLCKRRNDVVLKAELEAHFVYCRGEEELWTCDCQQIDHGIIDVNRWI
jgi:hypothetical protein